MKWYTKNESVAEHLQLCPKGCSVHSNIFSLQRLYVLTYEHGQPVLRTQGPFINSSSDVMEYARAEHFI